MPLLTEATLDSIPSNTLVRYVGMVQDMFNPEYYVSEFKDTEGVWHTTRYGDEMNESIEDSCEKRFDERHPFLVIPLPGRTAWLSEKYRDLASASIQDLRPKIEGSVGLKRHLYDISTGPEESLQETESPVEEEQAKACKSNKKAQTDGMSNDRRTSSQKRVIPHGSCVVHMYERNNGVKLNDVVEVLGVISRVPDLTPHTMLEEDEQDTLASRIPTSMAPRIHAICARKLNSILPANMPQVTTNQEIQLARAQTIGFLSTILGGDTLAAEYLLAQMISRVHMRTQDSNASPLGALTLNLTGIPDKSTDFVQALECALSGLVPSLLSLPLDIQLLNKKPWYPCKSQNQSFLNDALLQLPIGTVIMLDETAMTAGQLTEIGLKNLGAIQTMVQYQRLPYDFQFYQLDQPTDQPILIMSTGKTMLKGAGEVQIPLRATVTSLGGKKAVSDMLEAGNPDLARAYISKVRHLGFAIPQDLEKEIEQDMMEARKKDASNINAQTFHQWMNIARLYCLSHGETEMTLTRWRQVMDMEAQRLARCIPTNTCK